MDSDSPGSSGINPTNNPRLDLLHNTGDNQQLAGAAGSYGPRPTPASPPRQHPLPKPIAQSPPKAANSYVAAAESTRPTTPVPLPPPPTPPRPAPPPPPPSKPRSSRPLVIALVVLIILAAVGGGVWLWLSHRNTPSPPKPAPVTVTPATPSNLSQVDSSGSVIDAGSTTKQNKVTFHFNVSTNATSGSLTPEVELEPSGTTFTNQPTLTGQAVSAGGGNMQFTVTSNKLANGGYHWQVRVGTGSQHSAWVIFGSDPTATAFTVDTVTAATPSVTTVGGAPVANPTIVTSNRPVIIGKADPNATVTANVTPGSQQFTATADASGNWTITPTSDIPNGQHQLSITATNTAGSTSSPIQVSLSVNPATSADTTPTPAPASPPAASPPAATSTPPATTPAPAKNLAATGDNTTAVSLFSLLVMVVAAAGIIVVRRRYDTL